MIVRRQAVQQDGARPTLTLAAALLGAGETEPVTELLQHPLVLVGASDAGGGELSEVERNDRRHLRNRDDGGVDAGGGGAPTRPGTRRARHRGTWYPR